MSAVQPRARLCAPGRASGSRTGSRPTSKTAPRACSSTASICESHRLDRRAAAGHGQPAALRYTRRIARKGSIGMTTAYKLYGRPGSGSFAIQVALEEIGVPYERIWIANEPDVVAQYRKLNPTGRVPALGLPDGSVMFESAAILIHLALAHPGARLAPEPGTSAHARFLQWMGFFSGTVHE